MLKLYRHGETLAEASMALPDERPLVCHREARPRHERDGACSRTLLPDLGFRDIDRVLEQVIEAAHPRAVRQLDHVLLAAVDPLQYAPGQAARAALGDGAREVPYTLVRLGLEARPEDRR